MAKELTFAGILKNQIYKDRNTLYDLVPPEGFLHRVEQKNEMIMELAPILMNSAVQGIFVYGPPGTGKTALAMELRDELEKEAKKNKLTLKTAYVNCSENRTETIILIDILNQLNPGRDYPRLGWNRAKAVDEFNKILNDLGGNVLIMLDEVDYVLRESGDDILYRLSRTKSNANLSSILISNDIKVSDYIKPKTQSAIGRVRIIFSPYTSDELFDIIKQRAKLALKPKTYSDVVLKKIAEIEASRGGDARKALEMLDACAKIAIARKRTKITIDLVNEADKALERDSAITTLTSLTKHQKILFLSMVKLDQDMLNSDRIYKEYSKECKNYDVEPLTERRIRSFIVSFNEMGLIESEVGWLRTLKKKTRKITLNFDKAVKNKIRKVLRDSI